MPACNRWRGYSPLFCSCFPGAFLGGCVDLDSAMRLQDAKAQAVRLGAPSPYETLKLPSRILSFAVLCHTAGLAT